jgi:hypothetical protein
MMMKVLCVILALQNLEFSGCPQFDNEWCSDCDFYGLCVFCCQESMPLLESHQLNCAAIKERFGPFIEFGEVQN